MALMMSQGMNRGPLKRPIFLARIAGALSLMSLKGSFNTSFTFFDVAKPSDSEVIDQPLWRFS
jgi:hypothetical protein